MAVKELGAVRLEQREGESFQVGRIEPEERNTGLPAAERARPRHWSGAKEQKKSSADELVQEEGDRKHRERADGADDP